jgi:uncharacterized delta-60 repeat protein
VRREARILATAAATVLAVVSAGAGVAQALPGEFDTTFDTDGIRTVDTTTIDSGHALLVQPDGKIIQSGSNGTGVLVTRYLTDGSLDDGAFGVGYRIFPNAGTGQGVARAPNGDLIVAGTVLTGGTQYDIAVLRVRPDGMLDSGFGSGGVKTVDFGGNETATDVVVQPDGKIVVSGYTDTGELVVRLGSTGTPDASFDTDGKVALELGGTSYANAVALSGNKIVVGGYVRDADSSDMTAARLLTNGTPDPSFGDSGVKRIDAGTFDYGQDVLVQPDGKVLFTGSSDQQFVAARLTAGGALDQSFDGDGIAKVDTGGAATVWDSVLQANGKIVLAGQVVPSGMSSQQAVAVRLQPGGAIDTTFSFDGKQLVDLPTSQAEAVALQSDGRIILGGTTNPGANVDVFVARLEGDPPAIGGGPAPGQPGSPGGGGGGGGGGGSKTKVPRCAGKKATIVGTNRADKLKGTRRNDVIVALGGNDKIDGGGGNDIVCGGNGNDNLKGGAGKDGLYGQNGKDTESGGAGNDKVDGGAGNDKLSGDAGNDKLRGSSGNDSISGGLGKDGISGGAGKDRLSGGGGKDTCNGGASKDRATCEQVRAL